MIEILIVLFLLRIILQNVANILKFCFQVNQRDDVLNAGRICRFV